LEMDCVETSMSRDVLIQASMLPDAVRNAREEEVACFVADIIKLFYSALLLLLLLRNCCVFVTAIFLRITVN